MLRADNWIKNFEEVENDKEKEKSSSGKKYKIVIQGHLSSRK